MNSKDLARIVDGQVTASSIMDLIPAAMRPQRFPPPTKDELKVIAEAFKAVRGLAKPYTEQAIIIQGKMNLKLLEGICGTTLHSKLSRLSARSLADIFNEINEVRETDPTYALILQKIAEDGAGEIIHLSKNLTQEFLDSV